MKRCPRGQSKLDVFLDEKEDDNLQMLVRLVTI
jgi:hypothetical protein